MLTHTIVVSRLHIDIAIVDRDTFDTLKSWVFRSRRKQVAWHSAILYFAAMVRAMLLMLPDECLHLVLSQVTLQDLAHIAMVDKELHQLIQVWSRASIMRNCLSAFKVSAALPASQRGTSRTRRSRCATPCCANYL